MSKRPPNDETLEQIRPSLVQGTDDTEPESSQPILVSTDPQPPACDSHTHVQSTNTERVKVKPFDVAEQLLIGIAMSKPQRIKLAIFAFWSFVFVYVGFFCGALAIVVANQNQLSSSSPPFWLAMALWTHMAVMSLVTWVLPRPFWLRKCFSSVGVELEQRAGDIKNCWAVSLVYGLVPGLSYLLPVMTVAALLWKLNLNSSPFGCVFFFTVFFLAIIPATFMLIRFVFAPYVALYLGTGIKDSFRESYRMTDGILWQLFLYGILAYLRFGFGCVFYAFGVAWVESRYGPATAMVFLSRYRQMHNVNKSVM